MARRLSNFDFSPPKIESDPREKLLDGSIWRCTQEEDFPDKTVKSFKHGLQMMANKRGLSFKARILNDETIVVEASKKDEA